ncbi:hypothetical protein MARVELLAND_216 [Bacillus phage vB_BspM_MarvelLand]|nr:hypothetical protein MARVELLAND_216 [Bacillus phage vB_BspM_MarvelLand]
MVNLRVRDFYKRDNYDKFWHFLFGVVMCTFVLLPMAFMLRLYDKITGN